MRFLYDAIGVSRNPLDERSGLTDDELLVRWRQGDAGAGQCLFERHYPAVDRYFRNKVPAAISRDLVQRTFLKCIEAEPRFRHQAKFRSYLLGIAHHVMVDHLRSEARRGGRGGDCVDVDSLALADVQPIGEDAVAASRERLLLLRGLRRLRFEHQVVLELHYWEAMSDDRIAEVLGKPPGTIKTRLRRGKLELEHQLERLARSRDELRSTLDSLQRWALRVRREALPVGPEVPVAPEDPG